MLAKNKKKKKVKKRIKKVAEQTKEKIVQGLGKVDEDKESSIKAFEAQIEKVVWFSLLAVVYCPFGK